MKIKFLENLWVQKILSVLAISLVGFILLNLTFLAAFYFSNLLDGIMGLFGLTGETLNRDMYWYPPLRHFLFAVVVVVASLLIYKLKISDLIKAIYTPVPVATIMVTFGIFFYTIPALVYVMGGLFFLGALYYIYQTKQPWVYYYALISTTMLLLYGMLTGVEI